MASREIQLHDTRTARIVPLRPREPDRVGIYACGPTVYSRIHIGNARPFVVFSLLKRFLQHEGYATTLVMNITDVNDKIYDAARIRSERAGGSTVGGGSGAGGSTVGGGSGAGESTVGGGSGADGSTVGGGGVDGEPPIGSAALAAEMTAHYIVDTDALGLGRPDHEPLASETMEAIIGYIEALVDSGHAYESGGDVYFRVRSDPDYGSLSHRRLEDMDQGEDELGPHPPNPPAERKHDPLDFALWKAHKPGEDTSWGSPWGDGRPGWHIECSAMAEGLLGVGFDIHGGGSDLVFPHHENEASQTRAARGQELARIWMHNGMVQMTGEKMAKSTGNIMSLHEVVERYGRDAVVMYLISGHYRQPLAFSEAVLEQARSNVLRIREAGRRLSQGPSPDDLESLRDLFFDALARDFNTAEALAILNEWLREATSPLFDAPGDEHLREMLGMLGLEGLLAPIAQAPDRIRGLAAARERARGERDFALADRLREEIKASGWEVRDGSGGPELIPLSR